MSDTNISIVRSETDKITRYETAIKWVDIEPIMPTLKGALGFSAIVMNSNIAGTDIDGVLQWTEGMRNYKSTLDFGNLYFEKPKYPPKKDTVLSGINRVDAINGESVINRIVLFNATPKKLKINAEVISKTYKKTTQYKTEVQEPISELGITWTGENDKFSDYSFFLEIENDGSKSALLKKEYVINRYSSLSVQNKLQLLKKQVKKIHNYPNVSEQAKNTMQLYISALDEGLLLNRRAKQLERLFNEAREFFEEIADGKDTYKDPRTGKYFAGYKSKYDFTFQPYIVDVPKDYNKNTKYPLVVKLHGYSTEIAKINFWVEGIERGLKNSLQNNPNNQYIEVQPYGRGDAFYHMLGENDVFDVVAEIRKVYNIDPDRIYLDGFSMGGGGTWYIGLRHPDFWAAICPRGGVTKDHSNFIGDLSIYTINALNLPVYCIHGDKDTTVPIEHSKKMIESLKGYGYNVTFVEEKGLMHECSDQALQKRLEWLLMQKRNTTPKHIKFVCDTLSANKAYWLTVLSIQDYSKLGEIEAEISGKTDIKIKTNNIDRFLADIPVEITDKTKSITITIDGTSKIEVNAESNQKTIFSINSQGQWSLSNELYLNGNKKPGVCGPIAELFSDRFVFVYGNKLKDYVTGERDALVGEKWGQMMGDFSIKADSKVNSDDIKNANLILYGNTSNNKLIKKYLTLSKTPIQLTDKGAVINGKEYIGDCVFIIPNPENPEKLICISTVLSKNSTLTKIINRNLGDYTVYKAEDKYELLLNGWFDSKWQ